MDAESALLDFWKVFPFLADSLKKTGSSSIGRYGFIITQTQFVFVDPCLNQILSSFPFTQGTSTNLVAWLQGLLQRMAVETDTLQFTLTSSPTHIACLSPYNIGLSKARIGIVTPNGFGTSATTPEFLLHLMAVFINATQTVYLASDIGDIKGYRDQMKTLYPSFNETLFTHGGLPNRITAEWLQARKSDVVFVTDIKNGYYPQSPLYNGTPPYDLFREVANSGVKIFLVYANELRSVPVQIQSKASVILEIQSAGLVLQKKPDPTRCLLVKGSK